jgi:hypothetical protein
VRRVVTGMGAMKHEARKHGSRELTERVVPCCWIALCVAWLTCVAPTVLRIAIACGGARAKAAFSSPACCRRSCAAGPWRRGRLLEPPLLSEKGEERYRDVCQVARSRRVFYGGTGRIACATERRRNARATGAKQTRRNSTMARD